MLLGRLGQIKPRVSLYNVLAAILLGKLMEVQ
jgi:hypothetical protein